MNKQELIAKIAKDTGGRRQAPPVPLLTRGSRPAATTAAGQTCVDAPVGAKVYCLLL